MHLSVYFINIANFGVKEKEKVNLFYAKSLKTLHSKKGKDPKVLSWELLQWFWGVPVAVFQEMRNQFTWLMLFYSPTVALTTGSNILALDLL